MLATGATVSATGAGEPGAGEPGAGEPGDGEPGDGEPGDGEPDSSSLLSPLLSIGAPWAKLIGGGMPRVWVGGGAKYKKLKLSKWGNSKLKVSK